MLTQQTFQILGLTKHTQNTPLHLYYKNRFKLYINFGFSFSIYWKISKISNIWLSLIKYFHLLTYSGFGKISAFLYGARDCIRSSLVIRNLTNYILGGGGFWINIPIHYTNHINAMPIGGELHDTLSFIITLTSFVQIVIL